MTQIFESSNRTLSSRPLKGVLLVEMQLTAAWTRAATLGVTTHAGRAEGEAGALAAEPERV